LLQAKKSKKTREENFFVRENKDFAWGEEEGKIYLISFLLSAQKALFKKGNILIFMFKLLLNLLPSV